MFRLLQINYLFPALLSGIFLCGWAVHFHYCLMRMTVFKPLFIYLELRTPWWSGNNRELDYRHFNIKWSWLTNAILYQDVNYEQTNPFHANQLHCIAFSALYCKITNMWGEGGCATMCNSCRSSNKCKTKCFNSSTNIVECTL